VIRLTDRQEAFCQAMACNAGGAEASRRAGYSAKGAKQRGAFLMRQPEIRIRIDQIRASRRADHRTLLDEAAGQVETIIADALENKRCTLALRAIEFRLKLRGVIQDRRINHHYYIDHGHPDADVEHLKPDAEEELDAIRLLPPAKASTQPAPAAAIEAPAIPAIPSSRAGQQSDSTPVPKIVTPVSDLSGFLPKPLADGSLFASTSLTAPPSHPARQAISGFRVLRAA
jgi:hypothetical protein